jgi:hypothetical protein
MEIVEVPIFGNRKVIWKNTIVETMKRIVYLPCTVLTLKFCTGGRGGTPPLPLPPPPPYQDRTYTHGV